MMALLDFLADVKTRLIIDTAADWAVALGIPFTFLYLCHLDRMLKKILRCININGARIRQEIEIQGEEK
jgi:hypothetical protein